MQDKKRMRVSDEEITLLNAAFADNEELLIAIRNVFFGIATESEKMYVQSVFDGNESLKKLMHKMFFPTISGEIPIGQTIDLWLTLECKDKTDEEVESQLIARQKLIDHIKKSLALLDDVSGETVNLGVTVKTKKETVLARTHFVQHIEGVLMQIKLLAGQKNETPEEIKAKLAQNSSK